MSMSLLIFVADVDEYLEGLCNCHIYADCINRIGNYLCVCSNGYSGNGTDCCKCDTLICCSYSLVSVELYYNIKL